MAMQYRQDVVTRMPIMRVELITISIITIRSMWHNSAADFFVFWKISAANLRILWRHIPTELRNVQCVVKHTQSSSSRQNHSPIGLDHLKRCQSFFLFQRIVFLTGCTEKFGLIDRHAVSQQ